MRRRMPGTGSEWRGEGMEGARTWWEPAEERSMNGVRAVEEKAGTRQNARTDMRKRRVAMMRRESMVRGRERRGEEREAEGWETARR